MIEIINKPYLELEKDLTQEEKEAKNFLAQFGEGVENEY